MPASLDLVSTVIGFGLIIVAGGEVPSILELDGREPSTPTLDPIELHIRRPAAHR